MSFLSVALACGLATLVAPHGAAAQNLFEFLFGSGPKPPQRAAPQPPTDNPITNFFADPFGTNQQQTPQRQASSGGSGSGGPAFCVRTCDGKYFPLARNAASPAQMCQAFCPATATKVYFGSRIEDASEAEGEHYIESDNAFAFRKALKADCSCNGRGPAGLAAVDITLDASLKPGDVVATGNGLVAYAGNRSGSNDFTPVASFPGLTPETRAKLGDLKVAPLPGDPATAAAPPAADPAVAADAPVRSGGKTKRAVVDAGAAPPLRR